MCGWACILEFMEKEKTVIKISVRNLVEFLLRAGDLDNRRGGRREKEAMQAGSRIHRKIQRQMGSHYRAEVPLKLEVPMDQLVCVIEGRADGIFPEDGITFIDEIKGVYRDLAFLEEPVQVHLAQAMCYACIYAGEQGLSQIGVQMTYCNLETEEKRYFREIYSYSFLEEWFQKLMKEYEKWARYQMEWKEKRNASIRPVEFPFPYREGQRELAASVYKTIYRQKRLFIQAPTGVGKTMSALFPAVKAVGEGLGEKIFYLTAKTITRTVAADAFEILRRQGLQMKSIILTAKEKMCVCDEMECNPEQCPCAKGHYDRVNEAVFDLLISGETNLTREVLLAQAERFQVCPFEMSLDVSVWADALICDYNYVFDPNVALKRFFAEGNRGDYLFLIDEAHNLVERSREMYSARLYKEDFLEWKRSLKGMDKRLEKQLERCNKYLLEQKRECERYELLPDIGVFSLQLMNLISELERVLEYLEDPTLRKGLTEFYLKVYNFLNIYDRVDENYVIYTELDEEQRFSIRLFCIETAKNLRECLDKGNSAVFFSATLLPVQYYKHLLGAEDDYAIYAESPFSREQRLLLIGTDVSSRYTMRGQAQYERMAHYIGQAIRTRKGNYLVFFPSYKMLSDVYDCFLKLYGQEAEILLQASGMNEEQREEFLQAFSEEQEKSLVGFCVMGGIFSEGIDLTGERLIGTVIVGTGLPLVCNEREILKNYYNEKGMDGFEYAYRYPGMNKVLQSAGRVIRTREDVGVILLLDDRFAGSSYKKLFPREWEQYEICSIQTAAEKLERFWTKNNS